jgi:hypothetical protein
MVKLDIGCGSKKQEGFHGVDQYAMEGVDTVLNVGDEVWPWEDNSVDEIYASHFLEHLTAQQRIHFMNEAYRVMKDGAKATIITPHWASNRAYGDLTHQWPPVAEMFYFYLRPQWRETEAPHTDSRWNPKGYSCNFDAVYGYSMTPELQARSQDHVQFALANYKEAAQDLYATLTKPKQVTD